MEIGKVEKRKSGKVDTNNGKLKNQKSGKGYISRRRNEKHGKMEKVYAILKSETQ